VANPIEEHLLKVLGVFRGRPPEGELEDIRSLIVHREWAVGLENLCQQSFEHSIAVEPEILESIKELATQMKLPAKAWSFLATRW
jgi:hypothetical protein